MRRTVWVCTMLGVLVVAGLASPLGSSMIDLKVYRMGGTALLHGSDLYALALPGSGLAFTYPPFSAVLFIPYAAVPLPVARVASLVVSAVALWGLVHLTVVHVLRRLGSTAPPLRWSAPLALVATTAHPVFATLLYGQVNLWTTALVLVDVLLVRGRFRGTLVGVATGVKLVSGLFVVYFLVTRQFRAAGNAFLSFLATVAVGFAVLPRGSYDYWTALIFDPDRVGGITYVTNQSILGAAARLLRDPHPPSALTLSLSAIAAVAALVVARRYHHDGDPFTAVCLVATGSLLASPISWSHHWVWMIPALGVLLVWARERGGWWRWAVLGATTAILWAGAMSFMPKAGLRELHHTLPQQIVTNLYFALAVAFLVWSALPLRRATVSHRRGAMRRRWSRVEQVESGSSPAASTASR
ncbi:glycosyltransferase 87 family protein [Dactylosporangium sp. CA-233914]|uniref:glycosyltransferase 87 family protein n=1 Tax=Dactylosporangium sp. CA-233914 TaxID=3239934 RepID=UPI003D8DC583